MTILLATPAVVRMGALRVVMDDQTNPVIKPAMANRVAATGEARKLAIVNLMGAATKPAMISPAPTTGVASKPAMVNRKTLTLVGSSNRPMASLKTTTHTGTPEAVISKQTTPSETTEAVTIGLAIGRTNSKVPRAGIPMVKIKAAVVKSTTNSTKDPRAIMYDRTTTLTSANRVATIANLEIPTRAAPPAITSQAKTLTGAVRGCLVDLVITTTLALSVERIVVVVRGTSNGFHVGCSYPLQDMAVLKAMVLSGTIMTSLIAPVVIARDINPLISRLPKQKPITTHRAATEVAIIPTAETKEAVTATKKVTSKKVTIKNITMTTTRHMVRRS